MSKPAGKCAYCGGGNLTQEHFWGKWTAKYFPRGPDESTIHTVTLSGSTQSEIIQRGKLDRQGNTKTGKLRVVCFYCNNGWMRTTNLNAESVLVRLGIKNDWSNLSSAEAAALAKWACMFTMTYEFADKATLATPQDDRDHIRLKGSPPQGWNVWVGRYEGKDWASQTNHKGASVRNELTNMDNYNPYEMNTQMTVSTFGTLMFATYSTSVAFGPNASEVCDQIPFIKIHPAPAAVDAFKTERISDEAAYIAAHWLDGLRDPAHVFRPRMNWRLAEALPHLRLQPGE